MAIKTPFKNQQGSILFWGLVILLVMTVLGVAGARMAATDVKIAGNEIYQVLAYQGAESTLERATDLFFQTEAAKALDNQYISELFKDNALGGDVQSQARVVMSRKIACSALDDLAMSIAMNSDEYHCRLFDIEVDSKVLGTGTKSTHALGVMRLIPASANQ